MAFPPNNLLLPPAPGALKARDPDTDSEVLRRLIPSYADDFLMNPLVPLLPIVDGSFFSSLDSGAVQALLRCPYVPWYVLRELFLARAGLAFLGDARGALTNPRTPPAVLFKIVASRWDHQLTMPLAIALKLALERQGRRLLPQAQEEVSPSPKTLAALGEDAAVGVLAALFPVFVRQNDASFRAYAAAHPLCPPELLEQLAKDAKPSVRAAVSTNPSAPPALRLRMAQSQDAPVLAAMARDPESPPEVFEALALSSRVLPRMLVAEQPRAPESVLKVLSGDASPLVRQALSWNVAAREFFV